MRDVFAAFDEPLDGVDVAADVTEATGVASVGDPPGRDLVTSGAAAAVLAACGITVLVAQWGRWVTARVGGDPIVLQGIDLDVARVVFILLGLALVGVAVADLVRPGPRASWAGVVVGATLVLMAGLLILALETISGLVPKDLIPVTIRRVSFRLAAGVGLWATLLAGLASLLAASGGVRLAVHRWRALQVEGGLLPTAVGQALVVVGALVLGIGRYESTFTASAARQDVVLEGWSTPWFGPGTVIALWLVILALPVLLVRPSLVASSLVAFAGWFAAFLGAVLLVAGSGVEWVEPILVEQLPDGATRDADLSAALGPAPLLVFVGGLLAAVGGLLTASVRGATAQVVGSRRDVA